MNTDKYAKFVEVGNFTTGERDAKFLAAMGLAGEAGETCDLIKKHLLHGKELDRDALKKELGDVFWYLVHTCNTFGIPLDEVVEANVVKLCDRYPDQYGDPGEWLSGQPARPVIGPAFYQD